MATCGLELKAFRDRLNGAVLAGAGLGAMALLAVWMLSGFGDAATDLIDNLPEALAAVVGASGGGNYAVSEMFSLVAPVVVIAIAISGGIGAVAGEERDHTAGLLLALPVTRRHLVTAKAAVLAVHIVITAGLFLAGFLAAPARFGAGVSVAGALAAGVHLAALGLAFGMIALAVSAATGSAAASFGVTAGLAVVANLTATVLPLVAGLEGVAKASPWYYYDASRPLVNGVDPGHLLVLLALGAAAYVVTVALMDRRDIGSGDQRGLIAMIPALDRLTRPVVRGVFAKALSERAVLVMMAGGCMAILTVGVCLMFDGLRETLAKISEDLPEGISRLFGDLDMGTPTGWISAELLSFTYPFVLVAVAVVLGVAAVAGEQKRHTLDLLLSAPVSRRHVVAAKAAAMVSVVVAVAVVWGAGLLVGSALAGLGLGLGRVAAALAHLALLAVFFGAVALALGSVVSSRAASGASAALVVASYFVESFLPLSDGLRPWAAVSPWHYYSASLPLANGADAVHLAALASSSVLALLAAALLVDRREVTE